MDTKEIKKRLDILYRGLLSYRESVIGSWHIDSYYHDLTYIRRGPLLLRGGGCFHDMWVLIPGDSKVTPYHGDPDRNPKQFPNVIGKAIEVSLSDDGPWLDYLAKEIPLMEAELKESYDKREAAEQKAKDERAAKRRAELDAAKAIFTREVNNINDYQR